MSLTRASCWNYISSLLEWKRVELHVCWFCILCGGLPVTVNSYITVLSDRRSENLPAQTDTNLSSHGRDDKVKLLTFPKTSITHSDKRKKNGFLQDGAMLACNIVPVTTKSKCSVCFEVLILGVFLQAQGWGRMWSTLVLQIKDGVARLQLDWAKCILYHDLGPLDPMVV